MHPYLAQALVEARIDELTRTTSDRRRRLGARQHHLPLRRNHSHR